MSISTVIGHFEGISLSEMDRVKLMNRTDRKFWFNIGHLEGLLSEISDDYYILEISGERNMQYTTTYFDTDDNQMYINHHRGKLNRTKIRRRCYQLTQTSFLEVKFKSNKGRTIKERIKADYDAPTFSAAESRFIEEQSPYSSQDLHATLSNAFRRLMLVSKSMDERCTIDQELTFRSGAVEAQLGQMVVVEVKSEGRAKSKIIEAMRARRLHPAGFSKYCMGRSITDNSLKQNLFRLKHRMIERQIGTKLESTLTIK